MRPSPMSAKEHITVSNLWDTAAGTRAKTADLALLSRFVGLACSWLPTLLKTAHNRRRSTICSSRSCGAEIPPAVGMRYVRLYRKKKQIVTTCFGEGAVSAVEERIHDEIVCSSVLRGHRDEPDRLRAASTARYSPVTLAIARIHLDPRCRDVCRLQPRDGAQPVS